MSHLIILIQSVSVDKENKNLLNHLRRIGQQGLKLNKWPKHLSLVCQPRLSPRWASTTNQTVHWTKCEQPTCFSGVRCHSLSTKSDDKRTHKCLIHPKWQLKLLVIGSTTRSQSSRRLMRIWTCPRPPSRTSREALVQAKHWVESISLNQLASLALLIRAKKVQE